MICSAALLARKVQTILAGIAVGVEIIHLASAAFADAAYLALLLKVGEVAVHSADADSLSRKSCFELLCRELLVGML